LQRNRETMDKELRENRKMMSSCSVEINFKNDKIKE
jgi:hypothetical protein